MLLSRRHAAAHQGGKWEFPGGKVESGESTVPALARELEEELGIVPTEFRPLIQVPWSYPELNVFLDVWMVTGYTGCPDGREGQEIRWFSPQALRHLDFPAANRPIVDALTSPEVIVITPIGAERAPGFEARMASHVSAGRWIHLRLPDLDAGAYSRVVERLLAHGQVMSHVILTSTLDEVVATGAAGLHLNSKRLMSMKEPPGSDITISASCHNPQQLQQAAAMGLHHVYLSPVLPTASHPKAQPIGWQVFSKWAKRTPLPVFALGGLDASCLETAWQHGAQGIAGIRGIW